MKKCYVAIAGVEKALVVGNAAEAVEYKRNVVVDCCYCDGATDCGLTGYADFAIDCVIDWFGCGCFLAALSAYNPLHHRCNKWTFRRPSNCDFGRLAVVLVVVAARGVLKDF